MTVTMFLFLDHPKNKVYKRYDELFAKKNASFFFQKYMYKEVSVYMFSSR